MKKKKVYLSVIRKSWNMKPEIRAFKTWRAAFNNTISAVVKQAEQLMAEGHAVSIEKLKDDTIYCKAEPLFIVGNLESHVIEEESDD